jgi:AraC-like DNA-binding protein
MPTPLRILKLRYREYSQDYVWPTHRHSAWQWYAVVYGNVRMLVDGRAFSLTPASSILIPPGLQRSPSCQGKAPGCILCEFRHPLPLEGMALRPLPIPPSALRAFYALVHELSAPGEASRRFMAEALFSQVLLSQWRLARSKHSPGRARPIANLPRAEEVGQRIEAFLSRHFREEVTRERLAREVGLSPSQCARLYRTARNKTLHGRLIELRLEEARTLLIGSGLSIADIAQEVGFESSSHFSQLLKRHNGVTPMAYRLRGGRLYEAKGV